MAKKNPKPIAPNSSLTRRSAKSEPLKVIFIYCEGEVTEPEYIKSFYASIKGKKKTILAPIMGGAGVPMTLVSACLAKKAELKKSSRVDSFEKNASIWAVFDVDEHPKINEAISLAKESGIRCAISNPCIEVWGLMHISLFERPSSRHEAQAELAKVMHDYHHDNNPIFPWARCEAAVETAIKRATSSLERRANEGSRFPNANPATNFHDLLIALRGDIAE